MLGGLNLRKSFSVNGRNEAGDKVTGGFNGGKIFGEMGKDMGLKKE